MFLMDEPSQMFPGTCPSALTREGPPHNRLGPPTFTRAGPRAGELSLLP